MIFWFLLLLIPSCVLSSPSSFRGPEILLPQRFCPFVAYTILCEKEARERVPFTFFAFLEPDVFRVKDLGKVFRSS